MSAMRVCPARDLTPGGLLLRVHAGPRLYLDDGTVEPTSAQGGLLPDSLLDDVVVDGDTARLVFRDGTDLDVPESALCEVAC